MALADTIRLGKLRIFINNLRIQNNEVTGGGYANKTICSKEFWKGIY